MNHASPSRHHNFRRRSLGGLWLLLLGLAGPSFAASIRGEALGPAGEALADVPVCLKTASVRSGCSKLQFTDRDGAYRFRGLKPGLVYTVHVFSDASASTRKLETYRNHVWSPAPRPVRLKRRTEKVVLPPFVGKFNFSNFQRAVRLSAADLPELAEFDLAGDYVVLKVTYSAGGPEHPPETIFLGQVSNPDQVRIEASLPLAALAIDYEIYSMSNSLRGSIALSDAQSP